MIRTARRAVAAALAAGLFAATAAADDTKLKVKEGDPFPDVPLQAAQVEKVPGKKAGDTVKVGDLKGKPVVVFFYPKANTGGWTIESCGFRDAYADFPAGTVVLGASADKMADQTTFIEKNNLPYPLLCDTELTLIRALGIQTPKGKMAQRVTFVVDKDGKVAKVYGHEGKLDLKKHPEEVLRFVKGLK